MQAEEEPLLFPCEGSNLYGVLHRPVHLHSGHRGVLVVVGGPQTRVGSHRQFLLLARHLAAHGVPVMRFDYRGMGDSEGESLGFEDVGEDIRSAVNQFFHLLPDLREVVIWGLCDAASAACFYAPGDERVSGLVLLNPWVRTEAGEARSYLKHYYLQRLFNPELWRKIRRGEFRVGESLRSLGGMVGGALGRGGDSAPRENATTKTGDDAPPLPERMLRGLNRFKGPVLLILSGKDLTAAEFRDCVAASKPWKRVLAQKRVTRRELPEADHTFSSRVWRDQVSDWTLEWLRSGF